MRLVVYGIEASSADVHAQEYCYLERLLELQLNKGLIALDNFDKKKAIAVSWKVTSTNVRKNLCQLVLVFEFM